MIFPIVGEAFVEFAVFLVGDIIGVAHPDRLGLIQLFVLGVFLLKIYIFMQLDKVVQETYNIQFIYY